MALCTLCSTLPILSPPPLSSSFNAYALHSRSLKHITSLRRSVRLTPSETAAQDAEPLGATYYDSLSSLYSASTACAVCKIVAHHVRAFDEEWRATKEGSMDMIGRGLGGPDWEMGVVSGINDTGGFMVVCRDGVKRGVVWVVAAVGLGVDSEFSYGEFTSESKMGSDADFDVDDDPLSGVVRGRVVQERPEESLKRAVGWVRECDEMHGGKDCHVTNTKLPARVIDLKIGSEGSVAVIETSGEQGSYAVLSHVWGEESLTSMTSTHFETNKFDVDIGKLPKIFQDAIRMTRELEMRYLWVDALCIPQDSKQDWSRSSAQVSWVYSNASIMLSATGSSSDTEGMFIPRSLPPRETFAYETEGKEGIIHVFPITRVSAARRDNETLLESEPLSQSAWATQESYLAPRILHFGSKQMYFECHGHFLSEDGFRMIGRTNTLHRGSHPDRNRATTPDLQSNSDIWAGVLYSYARRALTKSSDKLPALSGLARAMQAQNGDHYVAGFWRSKMIEGLIWQAIGTTTAVAEYRAPSWSWAAIDGPFGMFSIGVGPDSGEWTDMATILDIEVALKTENPYGEITNASVKMQAPLEPLLPIDDTSPGSGNIPKQKGAMMKTLNGAEDHAVRCIFDTPTHAEAAAEGPLCALLITKHAGEVGRCDGTATYHALIVKSVDGGEAIYRRLGKLVCSEISLGKCDWMEDKAKMTSLTLV